MLEGRLEDFRLLDVVQLLNASAKTGRLTLDAGARTARLDVREGRLVGVALPDGSTDQPSGAAVDEADGSEDARVDALVDLLLWHEGRFHFEGPAVQPQTPESAPSDPILDEARRRLQTWPQLAERVGGPRAVLALAVPRHHDPVTLTADRWRLVSLVDGRRAVSELAGLWGRGVYATHRALAELVDEGLLARVSDGHPETAVVAPTSDPGLFTPREVPAASPGSGEPAEPQRSLVIPPSVVYEGHGPRGLRTRFRAERIQDAPAEHEVDQSLLQRLIHGVENL